MSYQEFLSTKPLFYKKFDPTRMQRAYQLIQDRLTLPPIVHIVGTNGKGSTGRFLAGALKEAGYKVGHYTSPHILRFNERIWIDGKEVSDERLQEAHESLQKLLPQEVSESLSYFEYTTFMAMWLFQGLDFAVVEAGLGGEWDATSVFGSVLTLITTIDYDHQAFLGERIEEIAATKLRAIKKEAILGYQIHPEVREVARSFNVRFIEEFDIDLGALERLVHKEGLAPFFAKNLALAIAAAQELGVRIDPKRALSYRLPARMQRLGNIILDVGHNPLSARALREALQGDVVLVYNSYEDKPYRQILSILKPKIKRVEILPIEDERIVSQKKLIEAIESVGLEWSYFQRIEDENYLVYGSFKVIEEFVKRYGSKIL